MNAAQFVIKWRAASGHERGSAQEHFIDLCRLLGEKTPNEADPSRTFYMFEAGAKGPDGNGFADVWLRGKFAWEYKGTGRDLGEAYKQVNRYREALENPPLLVVCDFERFEIHTNWTNTEKWIYSFTNAQIESDEPVSIRTVTGAAGGAPQLVARQVLRAMFEDPGQLRPNRTTEQITREAAELFGKITSWLRKMKVDDMRVARFVTRTLFCMFATDIGLLPRETFSQILDIDLNDNKGFRRHLSELFSKMNTGGEFLLWRIPHFNGRLFEDDDVPEHVTTEEILILKKLNDLNWADVEPSIFGTFFERILDPGQRQKLGAHFTSRADIELIVEPVLMEPLRQEWSETKGNIQKYLDSASVRGTPNGTQQARIRKLLDSFQGRLSTIRVLDPACGSGNFLYVSLSLLKALEKEVLALGSVYGIELEPRVHPKQLFGLEISHYAVELASIVVWIGYLQWKHHNLMPLDDEEPILQPLDQIQLKDAILDLEGNAPREPQWPDAEVIVGNPPFLGGGLLRRRLGEDYVDGLFTVYDSRIPRFSDLCCYWFEKARAAIEAGRTRRAGLLATQAIRGGANRRVLERIKQSGDIFYAQADRKWIQDGVAVHVSMVGFDDGTETRRRLNSAYSEVAAGALDRALPVEGINANLTSLIDVTRAPRLLENLNISFQGPSPKAPFDIDPGDALRMLNAPLNPNGRPNSDVVRPLVTAWDLGHGSRGKWTLDFGLMTEREAAFYELPFEYVKKHVLPVRRGRRDDYRGAWWQYARPRPEMRQALEAKARYIATPRHSKHRFFAWVPPEALCNDSTIVFARDDDYFFGVLHSRVHEAWARATGTQLRDALSGFRYTPTTCFETFAFPAVVGDQSVRIAALAAELDRLREAWLHPATEGTVGIPSKELAGRTLTNLYNGRPTWLANAHEELDAAVFDAYGWPQGLSDQEILARLLALNLARDPA